MNNCYKCEKAGGKCSDCKENALKAKKLAPTVKAFVDSVQAPAGFVKTTGRGFHNGFECYPEGQMAGNTWILLENADAGIKIAMNVSDFPNTRYEKGQKIPCRNTMDDLCINGHTCFNTDKGWRTFDRRGVEDSFYLGEYSTPPQEVAKALQEQLVRIEEAKERAKGMISIPKFSYSVHQDQLEALKKKLKAGGSHTFTPAGFGTGHIVSTKRSRYATPMAKETAEFFGVPALFVQTFDHD